MRYPLLFSSLVLASLLSNGQSTIDVLHYKYNIEITDRNDTITGIATIRFGALQPLKTVVFDLTGIQKTGRGMVVTRVVADQPSSNVLLTYTHEKDQLQVELKSALKQNDSATISIYYKGIPADGLIISKNKFGKRTFFGDNWPNRAHNWIPCADNVADKAPVEFIVTAPSHYQVVSNGIQVEETNLAGEKKLSHWKEDVPLPTKVMVIAAAEFAVQPAGNVNCVPVSTWVFTGDREKGFFDYAPATDILSFFDNYIGPYPYKKLANVQSLTIFGGMENASAIFYAENSVDGKQDNDNLLAHEIAHQWFGNMATEKSFPHLWLSEGFATYMALLYMEKRYGSDSARHMREEDRQQVITFVKRSKRPVVDSVSSFMELLNANSYQKGGWILHMLRRQLGDDIFRKCIQQYYAGYAGKNAETKNLEEVMEKVSGKDLSTFFKQWLYSPGIPQPDIKWKYESSEKALKISITQLQQTMFDFPLELILQKQSGEKIDKQIRITQRQQNFTFPVEENTVLLAVDPHCDLLFDGKISKME